MSDNAPEEDILLSEGFIAVIGAVFNGLFGLVGHIGVCDFRNGREEEDDSEEEDEGRNTEIHPLDGLEGRAAGGSDIFEDHVGGENGSDDSSDGLESLCEVETHLGVSGGTTGSDEWVGRCFKGGETRTNDEHGSAETSKTALYARGPEHQSTNTIDAETCDECPSITVAADDPARVC